MARMRDNTCKLTKSGQKYCKKNGIVRFVPKTGRRRVTAVSGTSRRKRGGKCKRFKRVQAKGGGTVRRCAKFK